MADLVAGMPVLVLTNGAKIQWEAIDPTTGDPVADVLVTGALAYTTDLSGQIDGTEDTPGPSPVTGAYTTGSGTV